MANGQKPTALPIGRTAISIGGRIDRMDRIGGLNGLPEVTRIVDYKCGRYDVAKMSAKSADLLTPEKSDTDYVRQTLLYSFVAFTQSSTRSHQHEVIEPHLYFTSQDLTGDRVQTRVMIDKSPLTYDSSTHENYASLVERMVTDIVTERDFPQCEKCSPYCPFLRLCARQPAR